MLYELLRYGSLNNMMGLSTTQMKGAPRDREESKVGEGGLKKEINMAKGDDSEVEEMISLKTVNKRRKLPLFVT